MKRSRIVIFLLILVLLILSAYKVNDSMHLKSTSASSNISSTSPWNQLNNSKKPTISYVGLGDSLTKGERSSNGGYVGMLAGSLQQSLHKQVVVENEGISGLTSEQLLTKVTNHEYDPALKHADIITISIGGNDLLPMYQTHAYTKAIEQLPGIESQYKSNLHDILSSIRSVNSQAPILLLGLYNPRHVQGLLDTLAEQGINQWDNGIKEESTQFNNVWVANVADLIHGHEAQYISYDGVHPNDQGYSVIAQSMFSLLHAV